MIFFFHDDGTIIGYKAICTFVQFLCQMFSSQMQMIIANSGGVFLIWCLPGGTWCDVLRFKLLIPFTEEKKNHVHTEYNDCLVSLLIVHDFISHDI